MMGSKSECAAVREPIVSFKVSRGGTDYKYSIREENGEILFCAYYWDYHYSNKTVDINDVAVSREDMEELGRLCDKYLIDTNLKSNDGSYNAAAVEIVWKSGRCFQTSIEKWEKNENKSELVFIAQVLSFFDGLCKRLDACYYEKPARPFAEGNVIFFSYSEGRGGRRPESYELRDDLGDILFDVDVSTDAFDANSNAGACKAVQLSDERVSKDTMDKFNALCEELKLSEQQIQAASVTKLFIDPHWKKSPSVFDVERHRAIGSAGESGVAPSFTASWENGGILMMDNLPDDMAETFRQFFRSLVIHIQSKPEEKAPEGKVVSVRLSCANISRRQREKGVVSKDYWVKPNEYCFHLREEGGEFNFDGYCIFHEINCIHLGNRALKLKKISAAQEDMEALRTICEKNAFSEKWYSSLKKKIEDKKNIFGCDGEKERDRLEVIWENGARLDMRLYFDKKYIASMELKSYFCKLAERLDKTLPADGKIVSFKLNGAYSWKYERAGRFIPSMRRLLASPGSGMSTDQGTQMMQDKSQPRSREEADYLLKYEYDMREVDGEVLFSAYESDHPCIPNMRTLIKESISSIEDTHLETLRALCKKHAFAEEIQRYHGKRWDDFFESDVFIHDCSRNPNYDFFEIEWENGAHCEGTNLSREFRDFFSEVVNSILPRGTTIDGWKCSCGNTGNEGKFCTECGAPVPQNI